MEKGRMMLGIFLGIVIISTIIFTFVYKDVLFTNKINITYPDGCIETYENAELVSSECINGREMLEKQNRNPISPPGQYDISMPSLNLT